MKTINDKNAVNEDNLMNVKYMENTRDWVLLSKDL